MDRIHQHAEVGLIIIGRNEGERLRKCLESARFHRFIFYVDSGSTDDSIAMASKFGASVIRLSIPPKFTAARARNEGFRALLLANPNLEFIQTIDGDCELRDAWTATALDVMRKNPTLALVFGRRRERNPHLSIYNAICDDEWDLPVGLAAGCGGDAFIRVSALSSIDGYRSSMIAGEDSEMSMRLRKKGWELRRIDAEMTWHDADIVHFRQFWRRSVRAGHAFAEMAYLHPDARWPNWPRKCQSIVFWGLVAPLVAFTGAALAIIESSGWAILTVAVVTIWFIKVIQLRRRALERGLSPEVATQSSFLSMVSKSSEFIGLAAYHYNRISGRASEIIEYKRATKLKTNY